MPQFGDEISVANLKARMTYWWGELWSFLTQLSADSKAGDTNIKPFAIEAKDAVGWTVRDHVVHIALWELGIVALLKGESREQAMGFAADMWDQDVNQINAAIQARHKHLSWDEALALLQETHDRLLVMIDTLTDEDLLRPYTHFAPDSSSNTPVIGIIAGNTFGHYEEHLPWMKAIVGWNTDEPEEGA